MNFDQINFFFTHYIGNTSKIFERLLIKFWKLEELGKWATDNEIAVIKTRVKSGKQNKLRNFVKNSKKILT